MHVGASHARSVRATSKALSLRDSSRLRKDLFRCSTAVAMSNRKGRPNMNVDNSQSVTTTKKRKMSSQIRFYAVKVGHNPGVYDTWQECEQNITRFKNALFRTFPTRSEAEAFVAGYEQIAAVASEVEKYYGVAVGRKPGVYTDWESAQEQIVGWKGPKYRKFATRGEAEAFVRDVEDHTTPKAKPMPHPTPLKMVPKPTKVSIEARVNLATDHEQLEEKTVIRPVAKRLKYTDSNDGLISATARKITVGDDILTVHTDGSSLGNGKAGARAGFGVHFGKDDPRNVSERLQGEMQTNQRAELTAVLRALEIAPTHQETHIHTDSRYSINCVTVWYKNWERNEWQTSLKKPVLNRDLVKAILAKMREREACGAMTKFHWVKGHSNDPNNEAADRLAVRGAQMA